MATIAQTSEAASAEDGLNPSATVKYRIFDAETQAEALDALFAGSPATHDLYGDATVVLPKAGTRAEEVAPGIWDGEVRYAIQSTQPVASKEGPAEYSGDANGGTIRKLRSIETIGRFPLESTQPQFEPAPDQHGYIGVTKDSIEGVEVPAPGFNWTETHYLSKNVATWSYLIAAAAMRGTVNDDDFRGFPAHEVLLVDFHWSVRGAGDVACTFSFNRQASEENVVVHFGPEDESVFECGDKKGQEYIWVLSQDKEQTETKNGEEVPVAIVKEPRAVYIERIFEESDFSNLGIGTGAPTL